MLVWLTEHNLPTASQLIKKHKNITIYYHAIGAIGQGLQICSTMDLVKYQKTIFIY